MPPATDTIMARLLHDVRQPSPDTTIEALLMDNEQSIDHLREDMDRLAIQVERLLKERARMVAAIVAFARSDITISAAQPLLDLARELAPTLTPEPR